MRVEIVTPETVLYSGDADMVIARGTDGEVGVLKDHEPMVVSLAFGEMRLYQGEVVSDRFAVFGGFLEVRDNVVSVLSDDAEPASAINPVKAVEELARLENTPVDDDPRAAAALARARVRARVSGGE